MLGDLKTIIIGRQLRGGGRSESHKKGIGVPVKQFFMFLQLIVFVKI